METAIRFEEFMHRALHDPDHGYYAKRIHGIGRRGDFTTAPVISSMPARAIARWATAAMRESGCRDLIEIGPGNGALAAAVLKQLPWPTRWKTRLHLVEASAPLTRIQRESLGTKARWHRSPAEALDACHGNAVIFSNELVDAFAVRRFQNTAEGWQELMVKTSSGRDAIESLEKISALPLSSSFLQPHPVGQWIEVHESYQRWLAEWMPLWKAGRMLTIDYGNTAEKIYHRRPTGTLRGYHFQQVIEGPEIYRHPGHRDLTADVNFTDLVDWTRPWTTASQLSSFAHFLQSHAKPRDENDRFLIDEHGAGSAFMVLDQICKKTA
ncbi:MAG: SAM-dependent methyltransferase [Verrucomicrobia bacterium]|nr:SAM-dependent methyltransferase [Verrucomicrobiota bacterium]